MKTIPRDSCVLSGKRDLEWLYTFKRFPVFMGCTTEPAAEDLFMDMSWHVGRASGCVQLNPLLPPEVVYKGAHNDAIGGIWQDHHHQLSDFILRYAGKSVLEIGGATGMLATKVRDKNSALGWTILEPNPALPHDSPIEVIRGFLTADFETKGNWDTVVHSHCFEHAYDPLAYLQQIHRILPSNGRHIFSFPNMRALLERYYTNCLNFEHTCFMDVEAAKWLLNEAGFEILQMRHFREDHSVFFATEKKPNILSLPMPQAFEKNKSLFLEYIRYNEDIVAKLNLQLEKVDGPVYLFGAHLFSQFLLNWGLRADKIVSVLDNSPAKIGKRLYGTPYQVESPAVLRDQVRPVVIVKAANYCEEIKQGILSQHNSSTRFLE